MVCDPRKNSRQGNKNDRIDARELSHRLYMNKLSSVYHGGAGVRTLRELARSYLTISKDLARVMSRVKAIYRSWGISWPASKSMRPVIVPSDLPRLPRWECFAGPSSTINNSMPWTVAPRSTARAAQRK